jgi:hypothetical protein
MVLPAELLEAAGVNAADPSREVTKLLTLGLYRKSGASLGRAAGTVRHADGGVQKKVEKIISEVSTVA